MSISIIEKIRTICAKNVGKESKMESNKTDIANPRIERCRFCHRFMGKNHDESHCVVHGWEEDKVRTVTEAECETCDGFKSKFIEYPITVQCIENKEINTSGLGHKCGCLCEIRPCGEEHQGKSYIGIYLGDLPIAIHTSFNDKTGILKNQTLNNPAIFVPELKKIIYGYESFWREIQSVEEFTGISEEDISNTWYMRLLNDLGENKKEDNEGKTKL